MTIGTCIAHHCHRRNRRMDK